MQIEKAAKAISDDFEKIFDPLLIINATESEDELGTVLRFHLLFEGMLDLYLKHKITADISPYISNLPREFGRKLSFSVAFGFPVVFAAPLKTLNKTRNALAHGTKQDLLSSDIKEFVRLSKAAIDKGDYGKGWDLERQYIELPEKRPGEKIQFGSGDLRLDFCITAMTLWRVIAKYLLQSSALQQVQSGEHR